MTPQPSDKNPAQEALAKLQTKLAQTEGDKARLAAIKARRTNTASGKGAWRKVFLESLRQIPNVAVACDAARVSRAWVYEARKRSKRFAKAWDTACQIAIDRLEAYCWKRAAIGVKRGVWMKDANGKPIKVEEIAEVSDGLAMLLLRAHRPEKYRDPPKELGATVTVASPTGETSVTFNIGVSKDELPE